MPIAQTTYTEDVQAGGFTFVSVSMRDDGGNTYSVSFYASPGYDIPARVAQLEAQMNEQLKEDELRGFLEGLA